MFSLMWIYFNVKGVPSSNKGITFYMKSVNHNEGIIILPRVCFPVGANPE